MPKRVKKASKVEIIPSINVDDFEEAKKRIKMVEKYAGGPDKGGIKWVHLDVSDGVFSKHVSWHDPKDLVGFEPKVKIELHLMTDRPERNIEKWLVRAVDRVIFHEEATKSRQLLIDKIHKAKKEAGMAIKPDTPWMKLFPYFKKVDVLLLLAVNPGPSGQKFSQEILHKLGHIRSICQGCKIEIDGGVNKKVASQCIKGGANLLVAGSAIFKAKNIKKAIKELKSGK